MTGGERLTDGGESRSAALPQIGPRAVLLGVALSSGLALLNPYGHYVARSWAIGWGALPGGVVFALFLLVVVNTALARVSPRHAFRRGEVLVAYGTGIIAYPLIRMYLPYLLGILSYSFYRASPENGWEHLIWPHIPSWSRPAGSEAVAWFWEGLPEGKGVPWGAWAAPMLVWGAFAAALMAAVFCLAALMSRDWIERQRLSFPLVEVPLAVVGDRPVATLRGGVFGKRLFWVGFSVPASISLLHWVSRLVPAVPDPTLDYLVGRSFAGMGLPWNVLGDMRIRLYFAVIGVACLVPGEVSLSLWLFYLLSRAELLALASAGLAAGGSTSAGGFNARSFVSFTEVGGFIALGLAALWQSRAALAAAARGLLPGARTQADLHAPLSPRGALMGFLFANALMLWWAVRAGMSWWSFAAITGLFYIAMITCSRLVAAAGVMRPDASVWPFPREVLIRTIGASAIGPTSLTVMAFISITYMMDIQDSAMPQMMSSFKLLHHERIRGGRFALAAAVVVGAVMVFCLVALLEVAYRHGAISLECWPLSGAATCAFRQLDASLRSPELADNWLRGAMVGGGGLTVLLVWLSNRLVWWPVSPVGFVFASSFFANYGLWFNALIGWALATAIRHYGGLGLYRTMRPGFLGLVLGEFLTRSGLAGLSLALGISAGDPLALS
ncbi:MAG: DUF6785 family protein [Armatimonadota bacterium]